jgi:hypothetical protein
MVDSPKSSPTPAELASIPPPSQPSWFERIWPFGREKRAQRRKIEQAFQDQLKEAYQRRGDLEEAARQLREERAQRQAESQRVPVRPKLVSRPSFQE